MSDFKAIKCTKFDFPWGPAGEAYSAVFKGTYS